MDDPVFESVDRVLDESGFIERVGMDSDLDVHFVGHGEASVDGTGGCSPIFVEFQAHRTSGDLFAEGLGIGGVPFSHEAEIHGIFLCGFEHTADVPGTGGASGSVGAGCGTGASACHGCDTAGKGFVDLLGADEVDVGVESAGGDDVTFAGNHFGGGSDDHVGVDAILNAGVPAVADADNVAVFYADIRFDYALFGVEDSGVGDYEVERVVVGGEGRLAHAVADDLAAAEFDFVAVAAVFGNEVTLHFYKNISVAQANLVTDCGAEHFSVLFSIEF